VKRLRRRFCEVGVLKPRERKGGRGICAQYWVDLEKAEALVREGRWGATKKGRKNGSKNKTGAGNSHAPTPFSSRWNRTPGAQTTPSCGSPPALPGHPFAGRKSRALSKMDWFPRRMCFGRGHIGLAKSTDYW